MAKRILVVEDLGSSAFIIAARLRQIVECDVEIARDLETATKILSEKTFDLITLDLGLPDAKDGQQVSDGLHTFNTILAFAIRTPIIVITIIDDAAVQKEIEDAGAFAYLTKEHFTQDELASNVNAALGTKMSEKITSDRELACPMLPNKSDGVSVRRVLVAIASVLASLGVIATAGSVAGDTRWVTKTEHEALRKETAESQQQAMTQIKYLFDTQRKQALDDEVYRIQRLPDHKLTEDQRAILARSLRQINEINQRWVTPPPSSR